MATQDPLLRPSYSVDFTYKVRILSASKIANFGTKSQMQPTVVL